MLNPLGITITAADLNLFQNVNDSFTVNVYVTPTTYVGNETTIGAWSLVSTGSGSTAGTDSPSNADLADFFLGAGTYGIAFQSDRGQNYTTGANVYSNSDVQLTLGAATLGVFASSVLSPRTWNGTIYYEEGNTAVPEPTYLPLMTGLLGLLALRFRKRRSN